MVPASIPLVTNIIVAKFIVWIDLMHPGGDKMDHTFQKAEKTRGAIKRGYNYDERFIQWAYDFDRFLQPQTVLEIGCAKGYLIRALRLLGIQAFGIDTDDYAIENADEFIKPYLKLTPTYDPPFKGPFGLVVAFDILQTVPEPDIFHVIDTISTLGVTIFLNQPHYYDPWDENKANVTLYPKIWWAREFESRGFQWIEQHPMLEKFNYTNGMIFTKGNLPTDLKTPVPTDHASDTERKLFAMCNSQDIF